MIAEIARFVRFARKVLIRVIISRMKYYKQVLAIEGLLSVKVVNKFEPSLNCKKQFNKRMKGKAYHYKFGMALLTVKKKKKKQMYSNDSEDAVEYKLKGYLLER